MLIPNCPTVGDDEIKAAFDRDLAENGTPADSTLFGRNVIALNSLGLGNYAFAKLTGLSRDFHRTPWYWEAARILCFSQPQSSFSIRYAFEHEAELLHDDGLTAEFRAYNADSLNDIDGALKILHSIPTDKLGDYTATLLLRIDLDRKDSAALPLARRTDCFDLRNGRHWAYLAQAEEQVRVGRCGARIAWLEGRLLLS